MITLITGTPGAGKTAFAVHQLSKIKDRPIFVMGIPELKIPHQPVPPVSEWVRDEPVPEDPALTRPVFNFPANAIIVIDEAQNVYRPRPVGSKVPPIVAAFETHRHTGVDFWLITQSPSLLDSNIRKLIAKHQHIHIAPLGRKLLEWSQARDPESKSDRADAIKSDYKPPKEAFGLYKSAEVHTKVNRKMSNSFKLFIAVMILLLILVPVIIGRVKDRVTGATAKEQTAVDQVYEAAGQKPIPTQSGLPPGAIPLTELNKTIPAIADQPDTAPIYDGVRLVKSMPEIQGCVASQSRCVCVTQQGTRAELSEQACRQWVSNRPFNPYRESLREPIREPMQLAKASMPADTGQPVLETGK